MRRTKKTAPDEVWVAELDMTYDGQHIAGIARTEDGAKAAAEAHNRDHMGAERAAADPLTWRLQHNADDGTTWWRGTNKELNATQHLYRVWREPLLP